MHLIAPGIRVPAVVELASGVPALDLPDVHGAQRGDVRALLEWVKLQAPADVAVRLEFDEVAETYFVRALHVESADDSGEIDSVFLRALRMGEIKSRAAMAAVTIADENYDPRVHPLTDAERRAGPRGRSLWMAAVVYKVAQICDAAPLAHVAAELDLQPRTATNWVKKAREAGLFYEMAPRVE